MTTRTSRAVPKASRAGTQISETTFRELIGQRSEHLLAAVRSFIRCPGGEAMNRPLVAELLSQSAQVEELLDAYGARNTRQWYPFRSLVATIKRFAEASYELLHIRHVLPSYRLLSIETDFGTATQATLDFCQEVIDHAGEGLLQTAACLELPIPEVGACCVYSEDLPTGRLPADRDTHQHGTAGENVTHLATAFLNLASRSDMLLLPSRTPPERYGDLIPDPVSEETMRRLQYQFHSLQSVYDTYVAGTTLERDDPDLPRLRGHISVVFHLLNVATAFAHYYERHVAPKLVGGESSQVAPRALLGHLMDYCLEFGGRYLICAQKLCQTMLKRYARVGSIEVSVPRYRGFHVRPSTLVAKIVTHYGSEVTLRLNGEAYDASSPIEIFRANEQINARKRKWVAEEVSHLPALKACSRGQLRATVRKVVNVLAEKGSIVVYERPLKLPERTIERHGELLQAVIDEIARLQATGRIDIETALTCTFVGDERVLADIRLLAEHGYGEDNFGNNIDLPAELSYLRR